LRRHLKNYQNTDPAAEFLGRLGFDFYLSAEAIERASRVLGIYLGFMFLVYCATFLWACPKPVLACAVAAEVFVFVISMLRLRAGLFDLPKCWWPGWAAGIRVGFEKSMTMFRSVRLMVLVVIAALVTLDFAAFATAAFSDSPLAISLYCIPGSQLIGLHPAATLEVLTGAYMEHKEFGRAEKLYMDILAVRAGVFGATSGQVGALYADLGDLNVRKGNLAKAEYWYRKSVELSESPGGPPGTGRALIGLATVLGQCGKLKESAECYQKALSIRARCYGTDSRQYHDTQRAYDKLLGLKQHAATSD
jgi:hypothetical protein